jgi:hypothetical protein
MFYTILGVGICLPDYTSDQVGNAKDCSPHIEAHSSQRAVNPGAAWEIEGK